MNSISEVFVYYDPDYVLLEKAQKIELVSVVLLYLTHLCGSSEMTEKIREITGWSGERGIEFRGILQGNGYIQKCLKFYIYEVVVGDRRINPKLYEVEDKDVLFAKTLHRSKHRNVLYLLSGLRRYVYQGFPPRSIAEFNTGLVRADKDLQITVAKYTNKKFRWLDQSGQLNKADAGRDMLNSALYSMYRAYPEISSFQHLRNIGIRAVHNRGVNILREHSTKSRQRITKNSDGTFSGHLLSTDHEGFSAVQVMDITTGGAISICTHMMTGLDGAPIPYERPEDVDRKRDLREAVAKLSGRLPGIGQRTFISLMMGEHNEEFSEWLGTPNDEACDSMPRTLYVERIREFLDVPTPIAAKFVRRLRETLKDYRN